jgi:predicted metalloprotease with PDZ domain
MRSGNKFVIPASLRKESNMSGLSALKLVSSKPIPKSNPREIRRQKLCKKLLQQMEMARCIKAGGNYDVVITKRVKDDETGGYKELQHLKKVKPWWWTAADGKTCLTVRYGAKTLELVNGRNAIETDGIDGVISALEVVQKAAQAGELDLQIEGLVNKKSEASATARPTLSLRKPA